jgi:hypothetical protein
MKTQLAALLAAGLLAAPALADDIFVTQDPGGFFGYTGFDVFPGQSVAARFIPAHDYTFTHVGIWFMSNDFDGTTPQTVTITLRTDVNPGGEYSSAPSDTILETWTRNITAVGWNPVLEPYDSEAHPALHSGQKYWFVAESNVGAGANPVWVWSAEGNEFTALKKARAPLGKPAPAQPSGSASRALQSTSAPPTSTAMAISAPTATSHPSSPASPAVAPQPPAPTPPTSTATATSAPTQTSKPSSASSPAATAKDLGTPCLRHPRRPQTHDPAQTLFRLKA